MCVFLRYCSFNSSIPSLLLYAVLDTLSCINLYLTPIHISCVLVDVKPAAHEPIFRRGQIIFSGRLVCANSEKIGACRIISDSTRSHNVLTGLVG